MMVQLSGNCSLGIDVLFGFRSKLPVFASDHCWQQRNIVVDVAGSISFHVGDTLERHRSK